MDFTNFQYADLLQGEVLQTWIRIMQWVWVFLAFYVSAQLFRGGYDDLIEIVGSPYANARERFQARMKMVTRTLALVLAGLVGATQIALPFWFQGAILIVIWNQISNALNG